MERIGSGISLLPIAIVMTDKIPLTIFEGSCIIIINLHPTNGTHWVLVVRINYCNVFYFEISVVETPQNFLNSCVDLRSDIRIQHIKDLTVVLVVYI